MSPKPTVILVPGAWHTEHAYHKLVPDIERRGYPTRTIRNPSLGQPGADGLVAKDGAHLRSVIDSYLDAGTDVVVAAHSYGGSVLTESLADYAWKKDEAGRGRVLGLVYIAAFLLPEGKSFRQFLLLPDGEGSPFEPDETNRLQPPDPIVFYNDLPEDEQRALHAGLIPNPASVGREPSRGHLWRRVPAVYIKTGRDIIIPVEVQQNMLDAAAAEGEGDPERKDVHVVLLDSSHSPMLSMPEKVTDAVVLAEELGRTAVAGEGLVA